MAVKGPVAPGGQRVTHLAQFPVEGDVVWTIERPNAEDCSQPDSARFMFNGPFATPAGGTGIGTFDFPAQVLHNGAGDTLPNGYACGPVADTWFVMRGQLGQFICISHDASHPTHVGSQSSVHAVWVRASSGDGGLHAYWTGGGPAIHNGSDVPMFQGAFELGGRNGAFLKDGWMTVGASGVWNFGFQCTLVGALGGPSVAPRGSVLRLGLAKRDLQQNETLLPWTGMRKQDIETGIPKDTEGSGDVTWDQLRAAINDNLLVTQENVAFTGFVNLRAGEGLRIRNVGATADVLLAQFWMTRSIRFFDPNPPAERFGSI
jgi:hypothetical protein